MVSHDVCGRVEIAEEDAVFGADGMRNHEPALHRFTQQVLHRMIGAAETFHDERQDGRRVHGGEGLEAPVDFGDHAAILCQCGFHEHHEEIRAHGGEVDREHDNVRMGDAREHGFERGERTGVGREVFDDGQAAFRVWAVGATGDEEFARAGGAECCELALPERLAIDFQRRLVAAHARGAAACEQDGAEWIVD